jgi:hypothetical protein
VGVVLIISDTLFSFRFRPGEPQQFLWHEFHCPVMGSVVPRFRTTSRIWRPAGRKIADGSKPLSVRITVTENFGSSLSTGAASSISALATSVLPTSASSTSTSAATGSTAEGASAGGASTSTPHRGVGTGNQQKRDWRNTGQKTAQSPT